MGFAEIILIIVLSLFVLAVIIKAFYDKIHGKVSCDCCDHNCSCCRKAGGNK